MNGVIAAFGCTLGIVPHLLAALTGVAAFLQANPVAFEVLRYLGIAYLLYMALDSLRDNGPLRLDGKVSTHSPGRVVVSAVLINLLNPKLSLFFIAFLPQFIRGNVADTLPQMLALSAVFMAMTLAVFILYALAAALVRRHVVERPAILTWSRCASCSFMADHIDGMNLHLANHDVTMIAVSRAPLAEIERFRRRMGWQFKWVSSNGSPFNYDFRVSFTPEQVAKGQIDYNYGQWPMTGEEWPGVSAFYRDAAGNVFHTYSTYGRGVEVMMGTYAMLDLTPKGRNEARGMDWVRHHDRYLQTPPVSAGRMAG